MALALNEHLSRSRLWKMPSKGRVPATGQRKACLRMRCSLLACKVRRGRAAKASVLVTAFFHVGVVIMLWTADVLSFYRRRIDVYCGEIHRMSHSCSSP